MKKIIVQVLFFIVVFFSSSNAQDSIPGYISNYPGIPIVAATNLSAHALNDSMLGKMRELGVNGVLASELVAGDLERIISYGLKIFPYFVWSQFRSDYVTYYTDAYYTLWEAEGKGDGSNGDVELKHNGEVFLPEGGISGIKSIKGSPPVKLIYGPSYRQEPKYRLIPPFDSTKIIEYSAAYRLKIKLNGNPVPWNYTDDVVCTLKVVSLDGYYNPPAEKVIDSLVLKVSDFSGLDSWDTVTINYNLQSLLTYTEQEYIERLIRLPHDTTFSYDMMDYQVIWSGLNYLDLYVNNIEISDVKGRELLDPLIRSQIFHYVNHTHQNLNDPSKTMGWFGSNEPMTIDSYEPFRVVNNIIKNATNNQLRLYTGFTSGWLGWFGGPWPDNVPNGRIFKSSEFFKRTKLPIVQYNAHMYNWPYYRDENSDYILQNIEELIYRNLRRLDSLKIPFSIETQSGKFYKYEHSCEDETPFYVVPTPEQMLYHINLGLMYGMKELRCDPFFTIMSSKCPEQFYREGLVNVDDCSLTELGETWKDTVAPRMSGLPGKTVKKLSPSAQFIDIPLGNYSSAYDNFITAINYTDPQCESPTNPQNPGFDLGFFEKETDVKYFMILKRWYNNLNGCNLRLNYNLSDFQSGFLNWKLTDYIDTTFRTKSREDTIIFYVTEGDTKLFSLSPVVLYGGDILFNESFTANATDTLRDIMTVKPGKTLTISTGSVYNVKADIFVDSLGVLEIENGSTLNFLNNSALYVRGTLSVDPGVTFNFNNSTRDECIRIENGSIVSIQGCTFQNGSNGLVINNTANSVTLKNNQFTDFESAVSVSTAPQLIFQNNNISNSEMGLFVSNVSNAFIVNNQIVTTKEITLPGIFFHSSSGSIRANTVMGHSSGVLTANSSPMMGTNNLIYNNYHGLSIAPGSLPDLRAYWMMHNCSELPLYYPISGFNQITQNGGEYYEPMDDGSEIFLSESSVLMDYGCNDVTDNREVNDPPFTVKNIICGEPDLGGGSTLYIRQNNWGDTTVYPLSQRFCTIHVNYELANEPCPAPDNTTGCEYIVMAPDGTVIDTLLPRAEVPKELTEMEIMLAEADRKFNLQQFTEARILYENAILNYPEVKEQISAYAKLLMIERITGTDGFASLESFYNSRLNTLSDTLMRKMVMHLSNLCLVNELLIDEAVQNYQAIIDLNPGSEEAIMAEIDIYTANLLKENWGGPQKKMVKGISSIKDLSRLLKAKYGASSNILKEAEIPKEFMLFQNYPNPFNPVTTIKFGIPEDTKVELTVYDILGRKVMTLVNDYKPAGYYEVKFNAGRLSSGMYIYQVRTKDHTATRKMMYVK